MYKMVIVLNIILLPCSLLNNVLTSYLHRQMPFPILWPRKIHFCEGYLPIFLLFLSVEADNVIYNSDIINVKNTF